MKLSFRVVHPWLAIRMDLDHIARLESAARCLEPTSEEWENLVGQVTDYARDHIAGLRDAPAYVYRTDEARGLLESPIAEEGIAISDALALLRHNVDTIGIDPASSRFLGYIPGGGLLHSALGDLLAAISNRYASIFFASPGAARMENMLIRWTASILGYPATSAGFLSSGGSIANLSAVVTAREVHDVEGRAIDRSVVYLTEHTHHCVDKALRIAGLRSCHCHTVRMDDRYRMVPEALEEAIIAHKKAGLSPWMVVASAGTTNTGAVDPMRALGEIAHAHDLWYHAEGAYGAYFALCPEGREVLDGIETSDSVVLDPHKMLFLPYGTGALLVKDSGLLFRAHGGWADYMADAAEEGDGNVSSAFLSPELTKHFRALRMWLPLKVVGVAPFRAALSEKIYLARYFYEQLSQMRGFQLGPYPDLAIATYRYVPPTGDADLFNRRLAESIRKDGRVFLSTTQINGVRVLRLAVGCFRTHREDIDLTLEILREKAAELAQS